jgi:hypothetical protein
MLRRTIAEPFGPKGGVQAGIDTALVDNFDVSWSITAGGMRTCLVKSIKWIAGRRFINLNKFSYALGRYVWKHLVLTRPTNQIGTDVTADTLHIVENTLVVGLGRGRSREQQQKTENYLHNRSMRRMVFHLFKVRRTDAF